MFVPIKQNKTDCFRSGTTVAIKMAFLIFMMIFVMSFWLRLQQKQLCCFGKSTLILFILVARLKYNPTMMQ